LIRALVDKREYSIVFRLVKNDKSLQRQLVTILCNIDHIGKAISFGKKFNLNLSDFPKIVTSLKKENITYFIRQDKWYVLEDTLRDDEELLEYYCKYLISKKKAILADSILWRQGISTNKPEKFIPNPIYVDDAFWPTEELEDDSKRGEYINIRDFGLNPKKTFIGLTIMT